MTVKLFQQRKCPDGSSRCCRWLHCIIGITTFLSLSFANKYNVLLRAAPRLCKYPPIHLAENCTLRRPNDSNLLPQFPLPKHGNWKQRDILRMRVFSYKRLRKAWRADNWTFHVREAWRLHRPVDVNASFLAPGSRMIARLKANHAFAWTVRGPWLSQSADEMVYASQSQKHEKHLKDRLQAKIGEAKTKQAVLFAPRLNVSK